MPLRYQHGYLRCVQRKSGPSQWEFLWRENVGGRRIRRTAVIGSILFNYADRQWRECEGHTETNASCQQQMHSGCLHASENGH
jgi:hypothetical protein